MVVGEFTQDTDVLVIGGGPGGYAAAFRAAQLGRQVLLVDSRPALGGTCLHDGCIPTKTRLHRAERGHEPGDRGAQAVTTLAGGLAAQARSLGVEVIGGSAHFEDNRNVQITGESVSRVRFKRAIIATGSSAVTEGDAMSPDTLATLDSIPKSAVVLGTGYLALEAAALLRAEGAEVTLATGPDGPLPVLPRPLLKPLLRSMKQSGIVLDEHSPETKRDGLVVDARARCAATGSLQLARVGVDTNDAGWIEVDHQQRTSEPRVFAVGDVTGGCLLAGAALTQGRVAAEAICGHPSAYEPAAIPQLVFTDPNVAWCGELQPDDDTCVTSIPWGHSGRAVGMDAATGVTMLHWERNTELVLGVGLCGADACELIETAVLAIELGATLEDLAAVVPAHPTRSELLGEAARAARSGTPNG